MTRPLRFVPCLLALLVGIPGVRAESGPPPEQEEPAGIVLQAERILDNDRRSQNTFRFTVAPHEGFAAPAGSRILYFLDGRFVKDFGQQELPFGFERDLDGQRAGHHGARVDLESPDDEVIASAATSVEISRAETGGQAAEVATRGSLEGDSE